MTQFTSRPAKAAAGLGVVAALVLAMSAPQALAQDDVFDKPVEGAPPKPPHATSSLSATAPTAAELRQTRALATAVFSQPGAAARAADKATAAATPDLNVVQQPKPEWSEKDGVQVTDKGVGFKSPF